MPPIKVLLFINFVKMFQGLNFVKPGLKYRLKKPPSNFIFSLSIIGYIDTNLSENITKLTHADL